MNKLMAVFLAVSYLSFSTLAIAAHPLSSDDTGTQGMMKFQLETSAEFGWDKETVQGITTKTNYQKLNVAATAGVLDSIDLALTYPFTWQKIEENTGNKLDNNGLNDLSMTLKWRLLELGPVSFGIKPSITFPTGNRDRNLGAGRASYGATLISTIKFKPIAVHANIGYSNKKYTDADKDGSREHLWNLTLAGTVEVLKGLQLVAEVGSATNPHRGNATWPTFITGGIIYSVLDNLDLDLGIKDSLNAPETDFALLTGLTVKLP